ncbi:hypothetical protein T11_9366 [Trichinella zimbabwensis]|uniref:Uncharacterized protein n=1 Tax=Trichinella zimbabwensis TaxID=268475 RepID=A0A0V1HGU9_9BILA|nr:hypothetical protein T11_9366 [Trichinella zimbabwensis]
MSNFCEHLSLLFIHPAEPYNPTQLLESFNGYHGPSTDLHNSQDHCQKWMDCPAHLFQKTFSFKHNVFTQILRCSHAVLDCASLKAEVWTCPNRLTSLEQASGIAEPVLP